MAFAWYCGWYSGFHKEGKIGCQKAIECGLNLKIDTDNLKFYEEEENNKNKSKTKLKKDFIEIECKELYKQFPNLTTQQILNKAKKIGN